MSKVKAKLANIFNALDNKITDALVAFNAGNDETSERAVMIKGALMGDGAAFITSSLFLSAQEALMGSPVPVTEAGLVIPFMVTAGIGGGVSVAQRYHKKIEAKTARQLKLF